MKRLLSFLISVIMATASLSICVNAKVKLTELTPKEKLDAVKQYAVSVISPEDFVNRTGENVDNTYVNTAYGTCTKESITETGLGFTSAMKLTLTKLPSSVTEFSYFCILKPEAISAGDVLLLKYTVKSDSSAGKMGVRLHDNTQSSNTTAEYNCVSIWSTGVPTTWTTYYYPMTGIANCNQFLFRLGFTLQTLYIGDFEIINYGKNIDKSVLPSGAYEVIPDESDIPEETNVTESITSSAFIENAAVTNGANGTLTVGDVHYSGFDYTKELLLSRTSNSGTVGAACTLDTGRSIVAGNILGLSFYARGKEKVMPLDVSLTTQGGSRVDSFTYYIPTQWTKVCIPFSAKSSIAGVLFELSKRSGEIEITGVSLKNYLDTKTTLELDSGLFMCPEEDVDEIVLDYVQSGAGVFKSADVVSDGSYLYSIGNGRFDILSISNPAKPTKVSSIEGFGSVRQVRLTKNGDAAVLTSRQDGMYIVDISDKTKPKMLSHYDTIEFATGLAISDDYAFVSCRMFGTEIIDITDYENPKHVSIIHSGEAQSCEIIDGKLFAGCWGERRVEVYDVANPLAPTKICDIPVNGKGDGLAVKGDYLYVATGHSPDYISERASRGGIGWGLGNGMDIYCISDINNPVFMSSVKIDDHFYYSGNDWWTVKVTDDNICYFTNTFNGVYVYDVSKPEAPIRLAHISVGIPKGSARYESLLPSHRQNSATEYFPYDTTVRLQTPIGGIAAVDGYLYMAGNYTDLHTFDASAYNADYIKRIPVAEDAGEMTEKGKFYDFSALSDELSGFKHTVAGGQVYALAERNHLIYAACGMEGLKIYDEELNLLAQYDTAEIAGDVKIHENRLYCAEGMGGIGVYEIGADGTQLTEIGRYYSADGNARYAVKQIVLSPNANYILCHIGGLYAEMVCFSDLKAPYRWNNKVWSGSSLVYFRQMCNLVANRYACIYWYNNTMRWFDFGEDNGNEPILMREDFKSNFGMAGGCTPYGDKVLASLGSGLEVFDPTDATLKSLNDISKYAISSSISGTASPLGKIALSADLKLAMITHRYQSVISLVDISDVTKPVLLKQFNAEGNPDIPLFTEKFIYIPYGNAGIIRFSASQLSETPYSVSDSGKRIRFYGKKMNSETDIKASDLAGVKSIHFDMVDTVNASFASLNGLSELHFKGDADVTSLSLPADAKLYIHVNASKLKQYAQDNSIDYRIYGDLNNNKTIDAGDLCAMLFHFAAGTTKQSEMDFTDDGVITLSDVSAEMKFLSSNAS